MTEPSEAAKAKAREIMLGGYLEADRGHLARFIQQVSDAAKAAKGNRSPEADEILAPFILPEPVDPLVEAMSEAMCGIAGEDYNQPAADLREALAKRGLKIVKDET